MLYERSGLCKVQLEFKVNIPQDPVTPVLRSISTLYSYVIHHQSGSIFLMGPITRVNCGSFRNAPKQPPGPFQDHDPFNVSILKAHAVLYGSNGKAQDQHAEPRLSPIVKEAPDTGACPCLANHPSRDHVSQVLPCTLYTTFKDLSPPTSKAGNGSQ